MHWRRTLAVTKRLCDLRVCPPDVRTSVLPLTAAFRMENPQLSTAAPENTLHKDGHQRSYFSPGRVRSSLAFVLSLLQCLYRSSVRRLSVVVCEPSLLPSTSSSSSSSSSSFSSPPSSFSSPPCSPPPLCGHVFIIVILAAFATICPSTC